MNTNVQPGQPQAYGPAAGDQSIPMLVPPKALPIIPIVMAVLAFIIWKKLRGNEQSRSERAFSHVRDTVKSSNLPDNARGMLLNAVDHVESTSGVASRAAAGAAHTVGERLEEHAKRMHR